jgi:maltokinase
VTEPLHEVLTPFLRGARWFGGKGRDFTVTDVRRLAQLPAVAEGGPRSVIDLVEVEYTDSGDRELYQLPLVFYPDLQERLSHALVGHFEDPGHGLCWVYDAVHDRDSMDTWLRCFDRAASGPVDPGNPLRFHRVPGHDLDLESHSSLFSGEQSNSSVAFGEDSLLKVFRKVTPGVNPDIAIHEVLTEAGSDHVAALYGWLEVGWTGGDGSVLQLAMLQQFLRTASDGWDLALASVRNLFAEGDLHADEVGGDFAAESARLGTALGEVHTTLREHFPTTTLDTDQVTALARAMHGRLDEALGVVPALADHEAPLRATYDAVADLGSVAVQQIHGDLHLGQTLRTVKGWKIVDFEGEPARPYTERLVPDSPWRDVAGMLRSFDYAPAVVERTVGREGDDTGGEQRAFRGQEWSQRNREAFVVAYAGRALTDDESVLLAAYVADKAVYETVYETRNRPTWVGIPLDAIARLGDRPGSA